MDVLKQVKNGNDIVYSLLFRDDNRRKVGLSRGEEKVEDRKEAG